jgi:hypothetical protein
MVAMTALIRHPRCGILLCSGDPATPVSPVAKGANVICVITLSLPAGSSRLPCCGPARASVRRGYLIGLAGPVTGAMVGLHHRLRARAKVRGRLQDKASVRA